MLTKTAIVAVFTLVSTAPASGFLLARAPSREVTKQQSYPFTSLHRSNHYQGAATRSAYCLRQASTSSSANGCYREQQLHCRSGTVDLDFHSTRALSRCHHQGPVVPPATAFRRRLARRSSFIQRCCSESGYVTAPISNMAGKLSLQNSDITPYGSIYDTEDQMIMSAGTVGCRGMGSGRSYGSVGPLRASQVDGVALEEEHGPSEEEGGIRSSGESAG